VTPFSETSGTFVNCEGRVQSFSGAVRPLGEARPAWKVLRVLGNVLALPGFDYDSSEQVRDEVVAPGTIFVSGLDNGLAEAPVAPALPAADGLQRIADVPIYFADPLARRAASLQLTRDAAAPNARMSSATLAQAGLTAGAPVRVRQGQGEALLNVVLDEAVPAACIWIAAAHASTAALGDMFGAITVEPA